MTTWRLLLSAWDLEPSILAGCAALIAAYAALVRPLTARAAIYVTGVAIMLAALVSPIDVLGGYLFSAHMLQHLLLLLVVPPLLLLGLPPEGTRRFLTWGPARRVERVIGQPLVAWLLGSVTLWAWHWPALYDAAVVSQGAHILQHLSFLVTATIFWWPVLAPVPEARRLGFFAALGYLLAAGFVDSVLGIIITFAPTGLYPVYLHPIDRLGALPLIRGAWGLSAEADQQGGGLLMWVLGDPIYLVFILGLFARWYTAPDDDEERIANMGPGAEPARAV